MSNINAADWPAANEGPAINEKDACREIAMRLRREVLEPIKRRLIGKDEVVEILGVALVAGENAFLLGPPGTGKSALVHELAMSLKGKTFDYLLTRFTEPSELFGPFDLRKLRDGDLVTNTEGMLPEADFVFLDELLNANSAILNSLLLALNERVFRRGNQRMRLPMLMAVGASNRLPEDDALAALFDRFLLRVTCDNVADSRLDEVLNAGWQRESAPDGEAVLSTEDVTKLQRSITRVDLKSVLPAYGQLVLRLRTAGMPLSDRRAVRLQRVVAASALCCGRFEADISDLWVMRFIWDTPAQQETLAAQLNAVTSAHAGENTDSGAAQTTRVNLHPMADRDASPDPEHLATLLDEIAAAPEKPHASDALTLLAARIEWVKEDAARQHLQDRVNILRGELISKLTNPPVASN